MTHCLLGVWFHPSAAAILYFLKGVHLYLCFIKYIFFMDLLCQLVSLLSFTCSFFFLFFLFLHVDFLQESNILLSFTSFPFLCFLLPLNYFSNSLIFFSLLLRVFFQLSFLSLLYMPFSSCSFPYKFSLFFPLLHGCFSLNLWVHSYHAYNHPGWCFERE